MKTKMYRLILFSLLFVAGKSSLFAAGSATLTTTAVPAAAIFQGTNTNVVYITKMAVSGADVTTNNIQFTLSGTHDATDLTYVTIYFNPSTPTISGASYLGQSVANFAAPHTYSINIFRILTAGSIGYFLITVNVSPTATDNKTIRITGSTTPVVFGFTSSVSVTNNQNNGGGLQTIQAADITLTTSAVAAGTLYQGTNTNIIYVTKMKAATADVTTNNIQFTLSGTHDANDLTYVTVYFNPSTPTISGASYLGQSVATFAAPNTYSINIFRTLAAGSEGYFIITVNVSPTATDNKTVRIIGNTNPVVFGYTTAPNVTNSQNAGGGLQTVQAADITLTTSAVAAGTLYQGTNTNIVYVAKMNVATSDVSVNNIQFTLSGNHDASDLTYVTVYFNPSTPTISGASYLGQSVANFAAPHLYSINIFRTLAAGSIGYFIITVNVSPTATDNKTVRIIGNTNPVVFGYTTAPNVTNNQNASGGLQTIQAPDITLTTSPVVAGTLYQGTNTNIVYVTKMNVATSDVTVNNIQFTLSGTHDADDLTYVTVYFNPSTPAISGASYLGQSLANFAAPHTYSINIFRTLTAGSSGYFIITVNVSPTATDNKTVRITGATTPVVFGYTTAPNVTNSQTNGGGLQTIQAADITLTTSAVAAGTLYQGTNTNIIYVTKMNVATSDVSVNNIQFTLSGNHDANDLTYVTVYFNPSAPTISGASYLGQSVATFAAPNTYSINIFRTLSAASSGYFIITVNVSPTASDNKTVRIIGNTNPVVFGYTTAPNVTNNQNAGGGLQTIQAADITLTTSAVAAGNIARGSNTNIVYVTKMNVVTSDVTVNNIQFTLSGTHDADDLTYVTVYFNPSSPGISGASYLGQSVANFAAPHTYSINIFRTLTAGSSGYFIITVNVSATASLGKTVRVNGATDPVVFAYSTVPNVTNNQTNGGGVKTISSTAKPASDMITGNSVPHLSVAAARIYPNPAADLVFIEFVADAKGQATVQLTNEAGNVAGTRTCIIEKGSNKISMDVHQVFNGMYYINIQAGGQAIRLDKKILVKH